MYIYYYAIILILVIIYLLFFKKFLNDKNKSPHQKFATNYIPPLLGGYFIILIIFFSEQITLIQKVFFFFIFLSGTLSDFKILNSPTIRLIFQAIAILFFANFSGFNLYDTRIDFLDHLLQNFYFNLFFCSFCIIILVNGSNFIDGLNGLVSGYYIIVLLAIKYLGIYSDIADNNFLNLVIFVLILIFVLNLLNKIYLGDSGSYLLGFFIAALLITIYGNNSYISPYFIILLIWYPCYENLFSLTRKFKSKISPFSPDNFHLHQLILNQMIKKIKLGKNFLNNLTSGSILIYNFFIILIATRDISNTKFQIFLLIFNILIYTVVYIFLKKQKY